MSQQGFSDDAVRGKVSAEDMKRLLGLLDSVRFGSVTLIIQDGRVVQIEKNEKVRIK